MTVKILILIAYVAVFLGIGVIGMRKTRNVGDFFLGGRGIGLWLSSFSYATTYFSAVIFIGFAGKLGWGFGLDVMWIVLGNALIGSMLAWMILARHTRRITTQLNVMTMPEFLSARYGSPGLQYFSAIVIFLFLTPYSASVYMGLSYLFEANLGIPFDTALFFIAILTAIYLIMGGYHATTIADLVQGLIMIIGAILMVFFIVKAGGGFAASHDALAARYPIHVPTPPPAYILISLVILTSLGPWGLPQMVQKFYAIKNEAIIPKAMIVTTIFAFIIAGAAYYCGALTHVFFDAIPDNQPDRLIPRLLLEQTPGWLNIIILLLVLSASMSTLAGLVLVSSSAIAIDFYQGRQPSGQRQRRALVLMRVLCLVFVALSVIIAKAQLAVIVTLMSISWGLVAGCFLAPYLYGLFYKRGTAAAVWVSMFTAIGLSIILTIYFANQGKAQAMSPVVGALSMLVPMAVFPVVSAVTRRPVVS